MCVSPGKKIKIAILYCILKHALFWITLSSLLPSPTVGGGGYYVISSVSVLYVYLSVSRITAEVTSRFHWNMLLWFDLAMRRIDRITGGDPGSRSLFIFAQHCRQGHFGRFISICHGVTGRFSRNLAKWRKPTGNESTTFRERSDGLGSRIPDLSANLDSNPGSLLVKATKVQGLVALGAGGGMISLSAAFFLLWCSNTV